MRLYFDAAAYVVYDVIAAVFAEVTRTWPEEAASVNGSKLVYPTINVHADGASVTIVGANAAAAAAGIVKDVANCTFCLALATVGSDGQKSATSVVCATADGSASTASCDAKSAPACANESRAACPSNSECKPQAGGSAVCACPLDSQPWCAVVATTDTADATTLASTPATSSTSSSTTSTSTPAEPLSLRLKCVAGAIEEVLFAQLVMDDSIVGTFEYELGLHLKSAYGAQIDADLAFAFERFDPRQGGSVVAHVFAHEGGGGGRQALSGFDAITPASLFRLDSFVFAGSRVCSSATRFDAELPVVSTTVSTPTDEPFERTTSVPASEAGAGILNGFELTEGVITLIGAGAGVLLVLVIIACLTCKRKSRQYAAKTKQKALRVEQEQSQLRAAHVAAKQQENSQRAQLQREHAELQKQRQWQWNSGSKQFASMQPGSVRLAGHSLSPPTTPISWLGSAHTSAARGFHGTNAWESSAFEPTEESSL